MTNPRMHEDKFLLLVQWEVIPGHELHISKPRYFGLIQFLITSTQPLFTESSYRKDKAWKM
ncbi:hypothetical protein PISMIDRAFT_683636 [Pisolithus microcarpus 441]|uniref:Unplaced genomic scaffold scaffold_110, whole genome shotgun sequence n=1 Tax=Pisolithus microcarpus 441 TaxID=765257 RepID=A0A0C9YYH5_9AGAM|nr:hypothetical protein PISMIDRAFT_683636 [Pisolithus microcarpus 441]